MNIKPQTKSIQKLDLTFPARMRLRIFQRLWRGSKWDPSEDVNIAPKESQFFILAFHKTSLGEHHTQLHVVPLRRENRLDSPSCPSLPMLPALTSCPAWSPKMDPPAAHLSQPTLCILVERGSCHWRCPLADVLQAAFGADRQQQFPCAPKDHRIKACLGLEGMLKII